MRHFKYVFPLILAICIATSASAMRIAPTRAQLEANTNLQAAVLAKAIEQVDFSEDTFTHAEIQYCLDNNIEITRAKLYSPVLSDAQINSSVPVNWPNSRVTENEVTRQKTFAEYTTVIPVTGGYCLLFHGGFHDQNGNHNLPTFAQLKVWVNMAGGFMTISEVEEIKIIDENV